MNQSEKVLAMLKRKRPFGVKNYEFTDAKILRYSSRINELRKQHRITCERLYSKGKATSVYLYRLIEPKDQYKVDHSREVDGLRYEKSPWLQSKLKLFRS